MTRVVKRIDPQSLAKIGGACLAAAACLAAIPLLLFGLIGLLTGLPGRAPDSPLPFVFMVGFGICAPFLYGLMGYVQCLVIAWIYNFVAARLGGIAVEVD